MVGWRCVVVGGGVAVVMGVSGGSLAMWRWRWRCGGVVVAVWWCYSGVVEVAVAMAVAMAVGARWRCCGGGVAVRG